MEKNPLAAMPPSKSRTLESELLKAATPRADLNAIEEKSPPAYKVSPERRRTETLAFTEGSKFFSEPSEASTAARLLRVCPPTPSKVPPMNNVVPRNARPDTDTDTPAEYVTFASKLPTLPSAALTAASPRRFCPPMLVKRPAT